MTKPAINPPLPRRRPNSNEPTPEARRDENPDEPVPEARHDKASSSAGTGRGGYGDPPIKNRWPKGQSGNPQGKKPGTKSLHTLIEQELDVVIEVTERGKKKKYTKRKLAAMRIVNKAVEGDDKSLTVLLRRDGAMTVAVLPSASVSNEPLSPGEQSILDDFMNMARIAVEREIREGGA
ncbi:DUF5681 domain-containing protein [Novosphingobium sp.]|uniref:DUF5681 domain-containing protein n=1 Tax=Novosphingobium sp. TaxID=1874826 RepID=UPI003D109DD7